VDRHSEHGNVLFLILIAVALFAALSYAVTSSNRTGGGSTERERAGLVASEIINYEIALRTAVTKLQASGCSLENISFDHPGWGHNFYRHTPPSTDNCKVFHPQGGAVSFRNGLTWNPESALGPGWTVYINGETSVADVGTPDSELLMWIFLDDANICDVISDRLSVPLTPDTVSTHVFGTYDGSFQNLADNFGDDLGSAYVGTYSFCNSNNAYISVLAAR